MRAWRWSLLLPVVLLVLLEIALRQKPIVRAAIASKNLHCLENRFVLLCPGKKEYLLAGPRSFSVSTDAGGLRLTGIQQSDPSAPEVIVIGDSLSMGFGLSDSESFPWIVAQESALKVTNLAVDSLGPSGMQHALDRYFSNKRNLNHKERTFAWVFSPSDFADEERQLKLASLPFYALFSGNFYLQRYSALYAWLRIDRAAKKYAGPGEQALTGEGRRAGLPLPLITPAQRHPAFIRMEKILRQYRPLYLIFYPAAPKANMQQERIVADFAALHGAHIIWLEQEFAREDKRIVELYIPGDGHPGPLAARIFAASLLNRLRTESTGMERWLSPNRSKGTGQQPQL